jgi:alpha-ketoglutarate-dependent taurine dioxygenase
MSIDLIPLSPQVGVELRGLDPRAVDGAVTTLVRDALKAHHLILIRGVALSEDEQVQLSESVGRVSSRGGKGYAKAGRKVSHVSNMHDDGVFRDGELSFHSDLSFLEHLLTARSLHALVLPSWGGDTLFANVGAAYDELPEPMKERIAGLRARHAITYERDGISYVDEFVRPLVERHPESGRPILSASRAVTKEILGMERAEFRPLLKELWAHIENPRFIYRHQWRVHDFILWDNIALQHARTTFDPAEKRALRAVSIDSQKIAESVAA